MKTHLEMVYAIQTAMLKSAFTTARIVFLRLNASGKAFVDNTTTTAIARNHAILLDVPSTILIVAKTRLISE